MKAVSRISDYDQQFRPAPEQYLPEALTVRLILKGG